MKFNSGLKESFDILDFASNIKNNNAQNKKDTEQQFARNPDFVRPMNMRAVVNHINNKYGNSGPNLFSRTLLMIYHEERVSKNYIIGAPPTILMVLLNVM